VKFGADRLRLFGARKLGIKFTRNRTPTKDDSDDESPSRTLVVAGEAAWTLWAVSARSQGTHRARSYGREGAFERLCVGPAPMGELVVRIHSGAITGDQMPVRICVRLHSRATTKPVQPVKSTAGARCWHVIVSGVSGSPYRYISRPRCCGASVWSLPTKPCAGGCGKSAE